MKNFAKTMMLATATLALASVGSAATILPIGAQQAYAQPNFGQFTQATWVSLASIGTSLGITITPGTTSLSFIGVGGICYNPGSSTCAQLGDTPVANISSPIVGGFTANSGSTTFLGTSLAQWNTATDWTLDFANDFIVNGTTGTGSVLVPTTAAWVVFVFRDNFYNDNVEINNNLGVSVNGSAPAVSPEPATYAMMLAGLGAVAAFKRFRRS